MGYVTNANKENNTILILFVSISGLLVLFVMSTMLSMIMKSETSNNMFYIQVLNYSMPVVKGAAYDESDMVESEMNLKTAIASYFKIDIGNPINILSKENSFFSLANGYISSETAAEVSFNPFKLKDLSIFRSETQEEEDPKVVSGIYDPTLKKTLNETVPEVLIYHTHTTEYFLPATADAPFDENHSVVAVGSELARELRDNYGISVIHDKTIHNTLYNNSYTRSGETLDNYLAKYDSFKVIIDLHRDAGPPQIATVTGEQKAAKVMFVLSKSSPNYQQNLALADKLKEILDTRFPGMAKNHLQYNRGKGNFNQNKDPNVVLIEVGTQNNNVEEGLVTAKIIARTVAEYINRGN